MTTLTETTPTIGSYWYPKREGFTGPVKITSKYDEKLFFTYDLYRNDFVFSKNELTKREDIALSIPNLSEQLIQVKRHALVEQTYSTSLRNIVVITKPITVSRIKYGPFCLRFSFFPFDARVRIGNLTFVTLHNGRRLDHPYVANERPCMDSAEHLFLKSWEQKDLYQMTDLCIDFLQYSDGNPYLSRRLWNHYKQVYEGTPLCYEQ